MAKLITRRKALITGAGLIAAPSIIRAQSMAPIIVDGPQHGGGGNPFSLVAHTQLSGNGPGPWNSPAINTTGANLIVWGFGYYGVASTPYTSSVWGDSQSNTWTSVAAYDAGLGGSCAAVQLIYCYGPTTNAAHTFGMAAMNFTSYFVAAFSGSAASPLDQHNGNGAAGSPASLQPNSVTPTVDNELLVSVVCPIGNTMNIDSSFVTTDLVDYSGGNWMGGGMAYFKQTTAGALNPTWSWTSAAAGVGSAAMIATFK